jgi:hypothetical protein
VKTRTHFGHRIDMLDREGETIEHLAGVEDSLLADATYEAALRRWPKVAIILRQGARVLFGFLLAVGCKSCVRPVCAVPMTAGPDVIRRSGPYHSLALDSA